MKKYITFEDAELNSTLTTLGCNLHLIAGSIIYFSQYAKIHGVEHHGILDEVIKHINKTIRMLKLEFNLPEENNSCLESVSENKINEVVKRAQKDHDNPYKVTVPKLQELVRSFYEIAEREGKETNWQAFKTECKKML